MRKKRCTNSKDNLSRVLSHPHEILGSSPNAPAEQLQMRTMSVLSFTPRPVWERPQNNYGSNRWVAYSPRLSRYVITYSDLEHDQWVLLEANPAIIIFCEQPLRISVQLGLRTVITIFDFWVKWKCGCEEFREIKYEDQLTSSARVSRQVEAQKKWTELCSFRYSIFTETLIRANPLYLVNWKRILSQLGATHRFDLTIYCDAVMFVLCKAGLQLGELERQLRPLDSMLV